MLTENLKQFTWLETKLFVFNPIRLVHLSDFMKTANGKKTSNAIERIFFYDVHLLVDRDSIQTHVIIMEALLALC